MIEHKPNDLKQMLDEWWNKEPFGFDHPETYEGILELMCKSHEQSCAENKHLNNIIRAEAIDASTLEDRIQEAAHYNWLDYKYEQAIQDIEWLIGHTTFDLYLTSNYIYSKEELDKLSKYSKIIERYKVDE